MSDIINVAPRDVDFDQLSGNTYSTPLRDPLALDFPGQAYTPVDYSNFVAASNEVAYDLRQWYGIRTAHECPYILDLNFKFTTVHTSVYDLLTYDPPIVVQLGVSYDIADGNLNVQHVLRWGEKLSKQFSSPYEHLSVIHIGFGNLYALSEYNPVVAQHDIGYSIKLSVQHSVGVDYILQYGSSHVLTQHTSLYGSLRQVSTQHESIYRSAVPIVVQHAVTYSAVFTESVFAQHTITYRDSATVAAQSSYYYWLLDKVEVKAQHFLSYGTRVSVGVQHGIAYGSETTRKVLTQHSIAYQSTEKVETQHTAAYGSQETAYLRAQHAVTYSTTLPVLAQHANAYGSLDSVVVKSQHAAVYASSLPVYAQHTSAYGSADHSVIRSQHSATYGSTTLIEAQHASTYGSVDVTAVKSQHASTYAATLPVSVSHAVAYGFSISSAIKAQHTITYAGSMPVQAQHSAAYSYYVRSSVKAQHAIGYGYTSNVTTQHGAVYGTEVTHKLAVQHASRYGERSYVYAQHSVSYRYETAIPVASQHLINYGYTSVLRAQHSADYGYSSASRVASQHSVSYGTTSAVVGQHGVSYALGRTLGTLKTQHSVAYGSRQKLVGQHSIVYGTNGIPDVFAQHALVYGARTKLVKSHITSYSDSATVAAQNAVEYAIRAALTTQHAVRYSDVVPVRTQNKAVYSLSSYNRVVSQLSMFWSIRDEGIEIIPADIVVKIGDVAVEKRDVVITQDEDSVPYTVELEVLNLEHFNMFREGVYFTVDFLGEVYTFLYDGRSINRSDGAEVSMRVSGASDCILLDAPRADTVSVSFETIASLRQIVETILERSVTWEFLPLVVKPYRIMAENAYPLSLAVSLLQEVGAVIQAEPDGTLVVRKKYVQQPNEVSANNVDHVYSDYEDNLSVSESYNSRPGYNRFRVSENDAQFADTIEFVQDEDSDVSGTLRVYPSPYRVNLQVRQTVQGSAILLSNEEWVTREEVEEVEFVGGEANTNYPIHSLVSVEWVSTALSGVSHEAYSSTLNAGTTVNEGYGLAKVTYLTTSLNYRTSAPTGLSVQYVVEEN